jgi:hypothetical protein
MRILDSSNYVYEVYTNSRTLLGEYTDFVPRKAIFAYYRFRDIKTFYGDVLAGAICVF